MLVFVAVSFFIYGAASLYFFLHPDADPLAARPPSDGRALLILAAFFCLWGAFGLLTKRSFTGRLFSALILAEAAVVALWRLLFTNAAPWALRLSGAVEGFICFGVLIALMAAVRKGASIWR